MWQSPITTAKGWINAESPISGEVVFETTKVFTLGIMFGHFWGVGVLSPLWATAARPWWRKGIIDINIKIIITIAIAFDKFMKGLRFMEEVNGSDI
jgi:hypothetical protein